MPNIVLKNQSGTEVPYNNINKIVVPDNEGHNVEFVAGGGGSSDTLVFYHDSNKSSYTVREQGYNLRYDDRFGVQCYELGSEFVADYSSLIEYNNYYYAPISESRMTSLDGASMLGSIYTWAASIPSPETFEGPETSTFLAASYRSGDYNAEASIGAEILADGTCILKTPGEYGAWKRRGSDYDSYNGPLFLITSNSTSTIGSDFQPNTWYICYGSSPYQEERYDPDSGYERYVYVTEYSWEEAQYGYWDYLYLVRESAESKAAMFDWLECDWDPADIDEAAHYGAMWLPMTFGIEGRWDEYDHQWYIDEYACGNWSHLQEIGTLSIPSEQNNVYSISLCGQMIMKINPSDHDIGVFKANTSYYLAPQSCPEGDTYLLFHMHVR